MRCQQCDCALYFCILYEHGPVIIKVRLYPQAQPRGGCPACGCANRQYRWRSVLRSTRVQACMMACAQNADHRGRRSTAPCDGHGGVSCAKRPGHRVPPSWPTPKYRRRRRWLGVESQVGGFPSGLASRREEPTIHVYHHRGIRKVEESRGCRVEVQQSDRERVAETRCSWRGTARLIDTLAASRRGGRQAELDVTQIDEDVGGGGAHGGVGVEHHFR